MIPGTGEIVKRVCSVLKTMLQRERFDARCRVVRCERLREREGRGRSRTHRVVDIERQASGRRSHRRPWCRTWLPTASSSAATIVT